MFTRVLLNITKHKVLNVLLIFLLILSFAGITLSSVFAYKTNEFLNEIYDEDDFVLLSNQKLETSDEFGFILEETGLDTYTDVYEKVKKDYKNLDVDIDFYITNLEVTQFKSENSSDDEWYMDYGSDAHITFDEVNTKEMYDLEDDYDKNKVYVSKDLASKHDLKVGDVLDFETKSFPTFDESGQNEIVPVNVGNLEIGGFIEYNEEIQKEMDNAGEYGGEDMGDYTIYVPIEALLTLEKETMSPAYVNIAISGDDDQMKKVYDEVKGNSNEMHVYYSKNVEDEDLAFFVKIRNFFVITLVTTILIFALSMVSLNNNIMERRNSEFRLYNVFGVGTKEMFVQLILEKLSLIIFSLIIAVPLFLKLVMIGSNIVDNIVEYSLQSDMILVQLLYSTERYELVDTLTNGTTGIKANNLLISIFGIVIMIVITILIVLVQLIVNRNNIVNQRRGV